MRQYADFLLESNHIEGIDSTSDQEIQLAQAFMTLDIIDIAALEHVVDVFTKGGGVLRDKPNMNVRVGGYIPPRGGPQIRDKLYEILQDAQFGSWVPHAIHLRYEQLHPFTDGNGRSGRLLWLWMHDGQMSRGFLHQFYYDALAYSTLGSRGDE